MRIDEKLQRALHDEADAVDPLVDPDASAWTRIQARARRRRMERRAGIVTLAAAIAAVVAIGAVVLNDGDERVRIVPANTTTTQETAMSTTTTTAGRPSEPALFPGVWPFTSQAEVEAYERDPGVGMFNDPTQTALEFAREYLKFPDPVKVSGDDRRITLAPKKGSPLRTVVEVADVGGGDGPYAAVGASTANIKVTRPARGSTIPNPVTLTGNSTAYEATVNVEVRQDGGDKLGETYVMGGANGEFGDFAGDLTYSPPTKKAGALVFFTESAEDGGISEATVVRVAFGSTEKPGGVTRFSVFFHDRNGKLVEVARESGHTPGVLRAALESLFAGPQAEDGAGITSVFSTKTTGLLAGVTLRPDGTAVVDINDTVDNANSSEGSRILLEELNATVFQFSTVKRVEYRLKGSCDAFWQWLQYGDCRTVPRP